ncbi:MAG: 1-acyl-sn-glycerol-3-phosphate acyltransferase, partial [Deltaproteobacteria bacterium]|nr:1-acyl-sn-glycerol-3-phosphate acyltransferase [Deltaproteobacteria bacterium]
HDVPGRRLDIVSSHVGKQIEHIRKHRLGSFKKSSARVNAEVARSNRLHRELSRIGEKEGLSKAEIINRTNSILKKLAADFKPGVLSFFAVLTAFLWRRIYLGFVMSEVDKEKIRNAIGKGPLLLLPCHKSHIDYLAISEAMNSANIMLPHIAAGDNLSFWPMGFLFRSSGAFFIRRRFVDDNFYKSVVNAYIRKLINENYTIEVFIEGGRSRTGKLLKPKLGMLEMVLMALETLSGKDVGVLPLYVGYDKVIEIDSYIKETSGKKKSSESIFGMIKSVKILFNRYGKLYVKAGDWFSISSYLEQEGMNASFSDSQFRRNAAMQIAFKALKSINDNSIITLKTIVATSVLKFYNRCSKNEIEKMAFWTADILKSAGVDLAEDVENFINTNLRKELLDSVITEFIEDGYLGVLKTENSGSDKYIIKTGYRMHLDFYKNSLIYLVAPFALIGGVILDGKPGLSLSELHRGVLPLFNLFKWEFMISGKSEILDDDITPLVDASIFYLKKSGIIILNNDAIHIEKRDELKEIVNLLTTFFETYHCSLTVLRDKMTEAFTGVMRNEAYKRFDEGLKSGMYKNAEGRNRILFNNGFDAFKELKINRHTDGANPFCDECIATELLRKLDVFIKI